MAVGLLDQFAMVMFIGVFTQSYAAFAALALFNALVLSIIAALLVSARRGWRASPRISERRRIEPGEPLSRPFATSVVVPGGQGQSANQGS